MFRPARAIRHCLLPTPCPSLTTMQTSYRQNLRQCRWSSSGASNSEPKSQPPTQDSESRIVGINHLEQKLQNRIHLPLPTADTSNKHSPTLSFVPTFSDATINVSGPYVLLPMVDGRYLHCGIAPTPKANPEKLKQALIPLLTVRREDLEPARSFTVDCKSFGTLHWHLDEDGDMIHRHIAVPSKLEGDKILAQIQAAADEVNHHPHVYASDASALSLEASLRHITISCTSHYPTGLSRRDVRLADKINEVLQNVNVVCELPLDDLQQRCSEVMKQRRLHVRFNQEAKIEAVNRMQTRMNKRKEITESDTEQG